MARGKKKRLGWDPQVPQEARRVSIPSRLERMVRSGRFVNMNEAHAGSSVWVFLKCCYRKAYCLVPRTVPLSALDRFPRRRSREFWLRARFREVRRRSDAVPRN